MKSVPEEGHDREEASCFVIQAERVETGEQVFVLELMLNRIGPGGDEEL